MGWQQRIPLHPFDFMYTHSVCMLMNEVGGRNERETGCHRRYEFMRNNIGRLSVQRTKVYYFVFFTDTNWLINIKSIPCHLIMESEFNKFQVTAYRSNCIST